MQPNSRHQRVKTQTPQLSPQRRFSPGEFLSTLSHARSPPHPPTDSQTNTHDRILHYSRVDYPTHGESVCVGISAHHYRRRRNPLVFFPLSRTRFQQGPFFLSTQFKIFQQTGDFYSSRNVFTLTPRFHMISAALHASLDYFGEAEIPVKKKKKKKKMNEQTFILSHTSSRK